MICLSRSLQGQLPLPLPEAGLPLGALGFRLPGPLGEALGWQEMWHPHVHGTGGHQRVGAAAAPGGHRPLGCRGDAAPFTRQHSRLSADGLRYLLFTGDCPIQQEEMANLTGSKAYDLVQKALEAPPLKSTSSEARNLLRRLLELEASKRIAAAEALKHPWRLRPSRRSSFSPHFTSFHFIFSSFSQVFSEVQLGAGGCCRAGPPRLLPQASHEPRASA